MSSNARMWLSIVAVIVIILLVWWIVGAHSNNVSTSAPTAATAGANSAASTQGASQPATEQSTAATASSVGVNQSSSIDQDLASIDTQMNGLNTDSANSDAALNDKPVSQSQ